MKRAINPVTLGYNYKLVPVTFRPEVPQVLVEFSDAGSAQLSVFSAVLEDNTVVASNEVLLADTLSVEADLEIVGSYVSFDTPVFGSGKIFGTGNLQ